VEKSPDVATSIASRQDSQDSDRRRDELPGEGTAIDGRCRRETINARSGAINEDMRNIAEKPGVEDPVDTP